MWGNELLSVLSKRFSSFMRPLSFTVDCVISDGFECSTSSPSGSADSKLSCGVYGRGRIERECRPAALRTNNQFCRCCPSFVLIETSSMAWTNYQLFLAGLMLTTGSINTLSAKWVTSVFQIVSCVMLSQCRVAVLYWRLVKTIFNTVWINIKHII